MSTIRRWNPLREMAELQRAFDERWRQMVNEGDWSDISLALDVHETDTGYVVTTELPGVDVENINIKLDGDVLTIEGEMPEFVVEEQNTRTLLRERRYGKFRRGIRLPQPVNADAVEASFDNGVLHLNLPKVPEVQPRQIAVKSKS